MFFYIAVLPASPLLLPAYRRIHRLFYATSGESAVHRLLLFYIVVLPACPPLLPAPRRIHRLQSNQPPGRLVGWLIAWLLLGRLVGG